MLLPCIQATSVCNLSDDLYQVLVQGFQSSMSSSVQATLVGGSVEGFATFCMASLRMGVLNLLRLGALKEDFPERGPSRALSALPAAEAGTDAASLERPLRLCTGLTPGSVTALMALSSLDVSSGAGSCMEPMLDSACRFGVSKWPSLIALLSLDPAGVQVQCRLSTSVF